MWNFSIGYVAVSTVWVVELTEKIAAHLRDVNTPCREAPALHLPVPWTGLFLSSSAPQYFEGPEYNLVPSPKFHI